VCLLLLLLLLLSLSQLLSLLLFAVPACHDPQPSSSLVHLRNKLLSPASERSSSNL
jgi:hypothetical protein